MDSIIINQIKDVPVSRLTIVFENSDEIIIPFSIINQFTLNNLFKEENTEQTKNYPVIDDYYYTDDVTFVLNENITYLPFKMSYNTPEPIYYRISRGDIALFDIYFKDGTRSFIYVNYKSEYDALGAKNIYQSSEIIDGKLITTICKAKAPSDNSDDTTSNTSPKGFYIYQLIEYDPNYGEQIISSYTSEQVAVQEKKKKEIELSEEQARYQNCYNCPYDSEDSIENNIEKVKNYCSKYKFETVKDDEIYTLCENDLMYYPELSYSIKKEFVQT